MKQIASYKIPAPKPLSTTPERPPHLTSPAEERKIKRRVSRCLITSFRHGGGGRKYNITPVSILHSGNRPKSRISGK
jgi:hypothetical protein